MLADYYYAIPQGDLFAVDQIESSRIKLNQIKLLN